MGFVARARHFAEHQGAEAQANQRFVELSRRRRAGERPARSQDDFFNGLLSHVSPDTFEAARE